MAGGWKGSLAQVLREHNGIKSTDGTKSSNETQAKRSSVLYAAFSELRELGYKLDDVRQLKGKHVEALCRAWQSRGLAASTLQNNLSTLRTFANWVGKAGMVERADQYFQNGEASRSSINRTDKSWSAHGVNFEAKLAEIQALDERVAIQAELQQAFGLRNKEAVMLRPHLADKGTYLAVSIGTKGGRDRTVPIVTARQREVLERAKIFAATRTASTADPRRSLKQALDRYTNTLRKAGLTKKAAGVTAYGLRHQYAQERYQSYSGVASPLRDGSLAKLDRERDRVARLEVSEELGHSRESISTYYLGR